MSSNIQPVIEHAGHQHMIYDGSIEGLILPQCFDPVYWQEKHKLEKTSSGRGASWFVSADANSYVLRHYQRGGMVARFLNDQYLWTGLEKTRAWREWNILVYLQTLDLPGPVPVAAQVIQKGLFYRADLLTRRFTRAKSLSEILASRKLDNTIWSSIGKTIKRFHQNRVYHADLNAHNILLNDDQQVFIIDFDRAELRTGMDWCQQNIQRLRRSLNKIKAQNQQLNFAEQDWTALLAGYAQ